MGVSTKMIIPSSISVGYQERKDTYTGKLGYVIYTDAKGVLRKEASWNSWRNHGIATTKLDNVPTSGFVLNKKAGGYKTGWDVRRTVVRVYDPRDFEFEISIPNLIYILQECSAIKGKGLEGEFVYAWSGTELVLLPTSSVEYQECVKFTDYQTCKVGKAEIIEGHSYLMKDMTPVMYLGKHLYGPKGWRKEYEPLGQRHIFLDLKNGNYIPQTGFTKIAAKTSDAILPEYPAAYDAYKKSKYCFSEMTEIKIVEKQLKKPEQASYYYSDVALQKDGDKYYAVRIIKRREYDNATRTYDENKFEIVRGDEFVPAIKDGFCTVSDPPYGGHRDWDYVARKYKEAADVTVVTGEELFSREFYSAVVKTKNGLELDLIKQTHY